MKSSRKCTMKKLKRLYWLRKSSLMFLWCVYVYVLYVMLGICGKVWWMNRLALIINQKWWSKVDRNSACTRHSKKKTRHMQSIHSYLELVCWLWRRYFNIIYVFVYNIAWYFRWNGKWQIYSIEFNNIIKGKRRLSIYTTEHCLFDVYTHCTTAHTFAVSGK